MYIVHWFKVYFHTYAIKISLLHVLFSFLNCHYSDVQDSEICTTKMQYIYPHRHHMLTPSPNHWKSLSHTQHNRNTIHHHFQQSSYYNGAGDIFKVYWELVWDTLVFLCSSDLFSWTEMTGIHLSPWVLKILKIKKDVRDK